MFSASSNLLEQWAKDHGGSPVAMGNGYLFPDSTYYSGLMLNQGPLGKIERLKCQRRYHQLLLETIESDMRLGQQIRWPDRSNWRFAFYGEMPLIRESDDWYPDYPKALQHLAALADRERKAIHELSAMIEPEHQCEPYRIT